MKYIVQKHIEYGGETYAPGDIIDLQSAGHRSALGNAVGLTAPVAAGPGGPRGGAAGEADGLDGPDGRDGRDGRDDEAPVGKRRPKRRKGVH